MEQMPEVGIFWVFKGKLIAHGLPWKIAEDIAGFVNINIGHLQYWNTVQKLHPSLKNKEYEQIPRGRVIFHKNDDLFKVFLTGKIMSNRVKELIIQEFNLPEDKTEFITDEHYNL